MQHNSQNSGNNLFKTKIGLIAATLGSAVGLGSVWRFPAEAQQNGGAAFLIVYLACVCVLGIPVMVAETALGRAGRSDAIGSFKRLAPGKAWWIGGALGILSAYLIISFYMVVAGWTLEYLWDSITGALYSEVSATASGVESIFHTRMEDYICSDINPLIATFILIGVNIAVLLLGVQKGIERVSNILMPLLFLLLLVFTCYALTLPKAGDGLRYFLAPDFSKIDWDVAGNALGQAFFSLSLGIGVLVTYASYYPDSTNLTRTSVTVSLLTTVVAVMMGMIIFPAVFSFGMDLDRLRGTTLVFVTLPEVFAQMTGGRLWSILFFLLLLVAAITSTISLAEVSILFVQKRFRKSRLTSTMIVMLPLFITCALCSLSFGSLSGIKITGLNIFDFLDSITTRYLMPLCALIIVLFMGHWVKKHTLYDQITNHGRVSRHIYPILAFIIRYPAPLLILTILISKIFE